MAGSLGDRLGRGDMIAIGKVYREKLVSFEDYGVWIEGEKKQTDGKQYQRRRLPSRSNPPNPDRHGRFGPLGICSPPQLPSADFLPGPRSANPDGPGRC